MLDSFGNNPGLPSALRAIQRQLDAESSIAGLRGNRTDEELTASQLSFRIIERDQRHKRIGWGTAATTAGGVFYALLRLLG